MARQIISNRLNCNAGIMKWYSKELKTLVRAMNTECRKKLAELYKKHYPDITFDDTISSQARIALNELQKKYGDKFSEKAKILVESLLKKTNRYANWQFNKQLKDMLGEKAKDFALAGSVVSPEKSEIMKVILFDNVSLIKSIQSKYFTDITSAVARSIESGKGVKWLSEQLFEYGAETERRADLMAQDQTRKAYSSINLRNFQEAGIKKFKWLHSGGSRDPRPYHKDVLDGNIYDIDDPPIIDPKTKERGYPGQLPNCRCVMCAVLDFDDPASKTFDEWKENNHPRDKDGRFAASNTNGGSVEKSSLGDKIKKKERKALELPKEEFAMVMHELNSNLPKELKKKPVFYRAIGDFEYKVANKGFNDYTIIEKRGINDIYD